MTSVLVDSVDATYGTKECVFTCLSRRIGLTCLNARKAAYVLAGMDVPRSGT